MSTNLKAIYDVARYRPLGLIANPFLTSENGKDFDGAELDVIGETNTLLGTIIQASDTPNPRPILVTKGEVPSYYPSRAIGLVERSLAGDDGVDVLHAYVQLYLMRLGRVRSVLSVVTERLAFRDFDKTLELFIEQILAEPDTDLVAYQVLGEAAFAAFSERFRANPTATTLELFGDTTVERHPELSKLADTRLVNLELDVDETEADPEIDSTVGDSEPNAILLAETNREESESENNDQTLVDYIVEYSKVHYSPVIARGLRVYRERGLAALVTELNVTKAPKKTLAAVVRFARVRFKKVALIFDGFDDWPQVPVELRSLIVGNLSQIRWSLEQDAVLIFMLDEGAAPELVEAFGSGTRITWDFARVERFADAPDVIDTEAIDFWLAAAAAPGVAPLSMSDPVLSTLASETERFPEFALRAASAIENAAERGVSSLDEMALEAGRTAQLVGENGE